MFFRVTAEPNKLVRFRKSQSDDKDIYTSMQEAQRSQYSANKIKYCNILGLGFDWPKSYFSNHQQQVFLNETH